MKFRRIRTRLLIGILPIFGIAVIILTSLSVTNSRNVIEQETSQVMDAELRTAIVEVQKQLNNIETTCKVLAQTVAVSYSFTSLADYEKELANIVQSNDTVLGSGLWFEPFAYDASSEYVGPYVYKTGNGLSTTYDYSNADYNYFSQNYYALAKSSRSTVITNPYYDPTSGIIMSSCSVPILVDNTYLGCASVDMELSKVTAMVDNIKVGRTGSAMLLDSNGAYLAGVASDKITSGLEISNETNKSLATAGFIIMNNQSGQTQYQENKVTYNLYYTTLPQTNWKLAIQIDRAELNESVDRLMRELLIIFAVTVILSATAISLIVGRISKDIMSVQKFASSLAYGDLTIEPLKVKTSDEIGTMTEALNEMYEGNKEVIQRIAGHSADLTKSSETLRETSEVLNEQFAELHTYIGAINEAMVNTSASTEQVNASTQEVLSNVNLLSGHSDENAEIVNEFKNRSSQIEKEYQAAADAVARMAKQFEQELSLQSSTDDQSAQARKMLDYLQNHVLADYEKILNTAKQQSEYASCFDEISSSIHDMTTSMRNLITDVSGAIQTITDASQETTQISEAMVEAVDLSRDQVLQVSEISHKQDTIAFDLDQVVAQFKLE